MQYSKNVTLLGAGHANKGIIAEALHHAPIVVAADGGAKNAVKMGQMPELIVGDFDSIDEKILRNFPPERQIRIQEQDSTDFEKCLNTISAPLILGVGFLGRRIDHQLAAMNALVRNADQGCILLGKRDICFHVPANLKIELPRNTRFSLFPLSDVTGTSTGLKWPIDNLQFSPNARIGTSNHTVDDQVLLNMDTTGMLAILPRAALTAAVHALQVR